MHYTLNGTRVAVGGLTGDVGHGGAIISSVLATALTPLASLASAAILAIAALGFYFLLFPFSALSIGSIFGGSCSGRGNGGVGVSDDSRRSRAVRYNVLTKSALEALGYLPGWTRSEKTGVVPGIETQTESGRVVMLVKRR